MRMRIGKLPALVSRDTIILFAWLSFWVTVWANLSSWEFVLEINRWFRKRIALLPGLFIIQHGLGAHILLLYRTTILAMLYSRREDLLRKYNILYFTTHRHRASWQMSLRPSWQTLFVTIYRQRPAWRYKSGDFSFKSLRRRFSIHGKSQIELQARLYASSFAASRSRKLWLALLDFSLSVFLLIYIIGDGG